MIIGNSYNWLFFITLAFFIKIIPKKIHCLAFFISGCLFVYHYSPLCFFFYFPFTMFITYFSMDKSIEKNHIWLFIFVLFFIVFYHENFNHYQKIGILPLEILVLGFYNLMRVLHVFIESCFHKKKFNPGQLMAYLWYAPILFSGPVERMEEWKKYHLLVIKIDWKRVFKLLIRAIVFAYLAEFFYTNFTPNNINFKTATYLNTFLYSIFIGIVIYCRLSSYIDFTRSFSIVMGYPFKRPNFRSPHFSLSVASFWSRWNMSVARFATDYIIVSSLKHFSKKKLILTLFVNFLVVGLCHGMEIPLILWGALQAIAISTNITYLYLKHKNPILLRLDMKYFHPFIKWLITLTFLYLTSILIDPRAKEVFEALILPFKNIIFF
ncbi:MAG: hypothetical protein COB02_03035 [Candidatus Cloacimonadota bacterium]|nr:MAG: hypothetical protein COB02_03035 [Candidatus Cloacimonadota bacterium]